MSLFSGEDACSFLVFPDASSNKYSRGVADLLTGSDRFPGAGVLSSKGALRSGVGFCRYIGENQFCNSLVLNSCPEMVMGVGKCDSFLKSSHLKGRREKQFKALVDDQHAYRFVVFRLQTRYQQRNYQKMAYKVKNEVGSFSCNYSYLVERNEMLAS